MDDDEVDLNEHALRVFRDAYAQLNDPDRDEDMDGAIRLFRLIGRTHNSGRAREWLYEQTRLTLLDVTE